MSERLTRGVVGQISVGSSAASDHHDDYDVSADELPGTATLEPQIDGSLVKKPKVRRRRNKFPPERRKEVAEVRRRGACPICREKKVACKHALQDQDSSTVPNPPTEELSSIGTQWDAAQPQPKSYNPDLSIDSNIPTPQSRLKGLGYVDELCTIANLEPDDHVGPSAATAWPAHVRRLDPSRAPLNSNINLSPNTTPQNLFSPSHANSVSTHDGDDGLYRCYEEGCHGAPCVHELGLQRGQLLTHGDQQKQLSFRNPVDEHNLSHFSLRDPYFTEGQRADVAQGPVAYPAVEQTVVGMERDLGKWDQVQHFIDGSYHPGMQYTSVGQPRLQALGDEDFTQILKRMGRLGTSSRTAASVSGRSKARVQKVPRRRSTNPSKPEDQYHGSGHGRQLSLLRRLSIPGPIYGSRLSEMDAMVPAQQLQMLPTQQQFLPDGLQPDADLLHSLQQPRSPQGYHQQLRGGLAQPSIAALGQGQYETYVTEHAIQNSMLHGDSQSFLSSSPTGLSFHDREGYWPMHDHLHFTQPRPTPLQTLPYTTHSMIPDSDFGGDFTPIDYYSIPGNSQQDLYYADATSTDIPLTSASGHPSIAVNGKTLCVPKPSVHTYSMPHEEQGSYDALSYSPLVSSTSCSVSVSSARNDSLVQTAPQNNSTDLIDISGGGGHAGSSNEAHYAAWPGVGGKFMPVPFEVEVQDGDEPRSSVSDELHFMDWASLL